jgi:hypothetical protein
MPNEEFEECEEALRYAAGLKGLSLVRTGDTFALAHYKLTGATLDEIAAFLGTDVSPEAEYHRVEERRHADLRAMLKAEHAMIAELEEEKRKANERLMTELRTPKTSLSQTTTEADLAEICRRMAEIEEAKRTGKESSNVAWQDIKHSVNSLR